MFNQGVHNSQFYHVYFFLFSWYWLKLILTPTILVRDISAQVFWHHTMDFLARVFFSQDTFQHIDIFFLLTFWHKDISATWAVGKKKGYFVTLDIAAKDLQHMDVQLWGYFCTMHRTWTKHPSAVKSLCRNISIPKHLGAKIFLCRNLHGAKIIPLLKHPNVFFTKKLQRKLASVTKSLFGQVAPQEPERTNSLAAFRMLAWQSTSLVLFHEDFFSYKVRHFSLETAVQRSSLLTTILCAACFYSQFTLINLSTIF